MAIYYVPPLVGAIVSLLVPWVLIFFTQLARCFDLPHPARRVRAGHRRADAGR